MPESLFNKVEDLKFFLLQNKVTTIINSEIENAHKSPIFLKRLFYLRHSK